MPTIDQPHKKTSKPNDGVNVTLPTTLIEPLGELLQELALSKRKEREDKEKKPKSRWGKFWSWWKDYGASAATVVTIISALIGGLWTLNQYIIQERGKVAQQERQATLERQALIAQFASDLSDPAKRNASAYAFALLAGEDAVPLLISELVSSAKFGKDQVYLDALARSLIQIGDPVLTPILKINGQYLVLGGEENRRVVSATQPIIYYWLAYKPEYFTGKEKAFTAVEIEKQPLNYMDFSGIDFSGSIFNESQMCLTKFTSGKFSATKITASELGGASFANAQIRGMQIDEKTKAVEVHFTGATIGFSNFPRVNMPKSDWKEAKISDSYFDFANLQSANFGDSTITNSTFYDASLYNARFVNGTLDNTVFVGADLENADFTDASFKSYNVSLFGELEDKPRILLTEKSGKYEGGSAFVRGANFQNATGLNEEDRIYLCRWGAVNVPGGCKGIGVEDMSIVPTKHSTMYDWCY